MISFHKYLQKFVEDLIQKEDPVLTLNRDEDIRVSNIAFAFNNAGIIKLLQQRGL